MKKKGLGRRKKKKEKKLMNGGLYMSMAHPTFNVPESNRKQSHPIPSQPNNKPDHPAPKN
jgi:hypothetical protein